METMTLWLIDIRTLTDREADCMALLSAGRRAEAERFRQQSDRLHKAAAGLLLRHVLHINEDEDLQRNEHRKPRLIGDGPNFNLSHNGSYAVLAVYSRELGVDVEPIGDAMPPVIPKRFLQADELAWLDAEPTPERFAALWTRLESAIKADGRGFDMEQREFSVVESGTPWYLHTFVHDGHMISCAAGQPFEVRVIELSAENLLN